MTNPVAGHTHPQSPPDVTKRHPGTTPVPMYVANPSGKLPTSSVYKSADVTTAVNTAFKEVEQLPVFPRVAEVLAGNLQFAKDTNWTTDPHALLALSAEVSLLVRVLSDPGVQRIVGLLRGGEEAA